MVPFKSTRSNCKAQLFSSKSDLVTGEQWHLTSDLRGPEKNQSSQETNYNTWLRKKLTKKTITYTIIIIIYIYKLNNKWLTKYSTTCFLCFFPKHLPSSCWILEKNPATQRIPLWNLVNSPVTEDVAANNNLLVMEGHLP